MTKHSRYANTGLARKLPPPREMLQALNEHPNLTIPQVHKLLGWEGSPQTVRGALHRAGLKRSSRIYFPNPNAGRGPLSEHQMSHQEFWGRVDQTMIELEAKLRARAEYPQGRSGSVLRNRGRRRRRTAEIGET